MELADTYRRRLRERALDQYGYVTTADADQLEVPAVELRKLASRGGLDHVAYGLYRFDDIPPTRWDEYMEAVLRVGRDAHLTGDAVLSLHDLGLVNPRRIRVGTPHRVRSRIPNHIEVVQQRLGRPDLTTYEGIPSTTIARALLDCRGTVIPDRLTDAAREASARGLLRRSEARRVIDALEATA